MLVLVAFPYEHTPLSPRIDIPFLSPCCPAVVHSHRGLFLLAQNYCSRRRYTPSLACLSPFLSIVSEYKLSGHMWLVRMPANVHTVMLSDFNS